MSVMIPRAALIELGKLVAQDLAHGHVSDGMQQIGTMLAADFKAMTTLLDLLSKEAAKKMPKEMQVNAYAFLLGQGLEVLRHSIERGRSQAKDSVAQLGAQICMLAHDGKLAPPTVLLLLQQFVTAKLNVSDELQALMRELMEQAPASVSGPSAGDIDKFLNDLAAEYGDDAFAIQDLLGQQAATFPETHRAGMAAALLGATEPILPEAAIGWLLDAGAITRADTAQLLTQAAGSGKVSGTMLRRMITLRNWLPEADRPALDAAIRASRQKGVECAVVAPTKIIEVMATGLDGAGAQSLFVMVKLGRQYALASLLLKQGIGVRDAWARHGLSKSQVEAMVDQIDAQVEVFDSAMDYVRLALGHAISVNLVSGVLPPFGLLDVVEVLGLPTANPEPVSCDVVIARLIQEIPARMRNVAATNRALKASDTWENDYDFPESWFEDSSDLDALIDHEQPSFPQRLILILEKYLPSRRLRWAETLAWMALTLRYDPSNNGNWSKLALVAREIASERPLAEIPLMVRLAGTTLEAWQNRRS